MVSITRAKVSFLIPTLLRNILQVCGPLRVLRPSSRNTLAMTTLYLDYRNLYISAWRERIRLSLPNDADHKTHSCHISSDQNNSSPIASRHSYPGQPVHEHKKLYSERGHISFKTKFCSYSVNFHPHNRDGPKLATTRWLAGTYHYAIGLRNGVLIMTLRSTDRPFLHF